MNIEPFLIASTVRAVVGQRLVRKLCPDCRESYTPDKATLNELDEIFKVGNPAIMKHLHELDQAAYEGGIGKGSDKEPKSDIPISSTETSLGKLWRVHEGGCEKCGHIGYRGRMGIYEVLDNSAEIQKLIVSSGTSESIQEEAIKEGMLTMQYDGFVKALRGQTSVEEILRVTSDK